MRSLLAPLSLLAALALAAPAAAATVSSEGTVVTIAAPARERNAITVTRSGGGALTIRDARTPVTAGAGCTQTRPDRASCGSAQTTELVADVGPLADSILLGQSVAVRATLRGGSASDTLRGGRAGDLIAGGTGRDVVTYAGRREDVVVTLAGGADDGFAGEGDEVVEVERAVGGSGFDTLVGTEAGNGLSGGPGDDRLHGLGGIDTLTGGRGHDLLEGGAGEDVFMAERTPDGADTLRGDAGIDRADYSRRGGSVVVDPDGFADDGDRPGPTLTFTGPLPALLLLASPERDNVLPDVESVRSGVGADVISTANSGGTAEGGGGTDVVYGGPGPDNLAGDAGFDRIVARDRSRDTVRCGTEVDRAWVNLDDPVDFDCEQRSTSFVARVVPSARTLDASGLRVRVSCPAEAFVRCVGWLRVTTVRRVDNGRQARLGLARFGLVPGRTEEVVIPFDAFARGVVRRFAPLRARVAIQARDDAGPGARSSARLVLRG